MHSAINSLLDLVFPAFCQGCAREGTYLCLECQNRIETPIHRCPVCDRNSQLGRVHDNCRSRNIALSGLLIASDYKEPAIKNLIWHLKYNSVKDISQALALIMTDFLVDNDLADYFQQAVVVPVPMHPRRKRYRGFNQAEEIARHLSVNLKLQHISVLSKKLPTKRQVELEKNQRLENVKDSFSLTENFDVAALQDRPILLIDDVATTGATLNECAKAIRPLKPSEIWGFVVARN